MIMNAAPITSKDQNPVNALQLGTAWDFHSLGRITPPNSDTKWCPPIQKVGGASPRRARCGRGYSLEGGASLAFGLVWSLPFPRFCCSQLQ